MGLVSLFALWIFMVLLTFRRYYKFLEQHGTEEKKAEVLSKISMAEPKHGEIWQSVVKDPKNFRKGIEEMLKIAVAKAE